MMQNHALAKSIPEAAWTQFTALLACKSAWGRQAVGSGGPRVHESGRCGCGWRNPGLTLADRTSMYARCGLVIDRDRNAALNILARGRQLAKTYGIGMTMPAFGPEAQA